MISEHEFRLLLLLTAGFALVGVVSTAVPSSITTWMLVRDWRAWAARTAASVGGGPLGFRFYARLAGRAAMVVLYGAAIGGFLGWVAGMCFAAFNN